MLPDGAHHVTLHVSGTKSCRSDPIKEIQDVALPLGGIEKGDVRLDALGVEVELVLEHHVELTVEHHGRIYHLTGGIGRLVRETVYREERHGGDGRTTLAPLVHLGGLGGVQDVVERIGTYPVELFLRGHHGVLNEIVHLLVLLGEAPHLAKVRNRVSYGLTLLADKLVYAKRILAAKFYGSLKLVFSEAFREIQHGAPDIAVHTDDHLAGDLVDIDLIQDLGGAVLLLVLILQEAAHEVSDSGLRLSVVLIVFTGEDILHWNDNLCISPLPYLDLADTGSALEVQAADFPLGKLHQAEQQPLRVNAEIMSHRREDVRFDNFLRDGFLVLSLFFHYRESYNPEVSIFTSKDKRIS